MCGIAGVVDLRGLGRVPSPAVVDAMTDALARRGPDGRGTWRNKDAAFGHRRLAILDPTDAAAQPFTGADDGGRGRDDLSLVFNGEIYNFKELRAELVAKGHRFTSTGDTAVLLGAWLEWGPRCVEKLNGIFAFAVLDGQRFFLARDHIGIKPMFYAVHDGVLRFGSELKAILADPAVARAPDTAALDCYLTHAYAPAPLSPFAGIQQLPPASTLAAVVGDTRAPVVARYWRPTVQERVISYEDALAELRTRLHASVEAQMVSDVPLGAFLSGGLDSASVVAEMVRLTREPVRTFSIGFMQASFDEREGAAASALILGAHHKADVIDLDLDRTVRDVAETNDDLLADPSLLAVDHLCRLTRKEVTVALSGDGADELLAGYQTYAATYAARAWRMVPSPMRRLAKRGVKRVLRPSTERYSARDFALRFLGGAEQGPGRDFAAWRSYFTDDDRRELLRRPLTGGEPLDRYARLLDEAGGDATLLKRMLVADLLFYLPNDMLVKVDRASMRHGLEVRVPFLDHTFVDFALSLPSRFLLSPRGETKRILRTHVEQRVSRDTARRKKRGFSVPVGEALKGAMGDTLLDAVRSQPFASDGPLDSAAVERRLAAHRRGDVDATFSLYAVLVLALWWRRFLAP